MFTDGLRPARTFAIILIVHLAVIVLWQVLVDVFQVPKFILPSPLATVATLGSAKYAWAIQPCGDRGGNPRRLLRLARWSASCWRWCSAWSPLLSLMLLPLFVTLNMIPKVALGPLVIVWFSYGIFAEHPDRLLASASSRSC